MTMRYSLIRSGLTIPSWAAPGWATAAGLIFSLGCSGDLEEAPGTNPGNGNPIAEGTAGAGNIVEGGGSGTGAGGGAVVPVDPTAPGMGQLRRLSSTQYGRAIKDLLGDVGAIPAVEDFPAGDSLKAIAASITAVSPVGVESFEKAANAALTPVFADAARRDALIGCAPVAWDAACATSFLNTFGQRAWRRPLSADEVTRYLALGAEEVATGGTFADGAHAMASAILQSPNFLYRPELGSGVTVPGTTWSRFTPYETASRLSFLLWGTIPDEALIAAAASGALDTPEGIQGEAQRLIASERLMDGVNDMVDDMLSLESVFLMAKDQVLFPELSPTLRQAMREEILALFRDVAITRDSDLLELFDTNKTFVNEELAALYGIEGVTGTALVEAQHPEGTPRAGLLTSALLLSVQDKKNETSPTRRGKFVSTVFNCDKIPDPPPGVSTVIEPPPPGQVLSRRELLADHMQDPTCAGCHALMDPVGLSFENFDAMGRYRTNEDNGLVIDPSGTYGGQPFATPRELGALMRASDKVKSCLVRRIYRYTVGRIENQYDNAQIDALATKFIAGGQRFSPLLLDLVQSDGFLNVTPVVQ